MGVSLSIYPSFKGIYVILISPPSVNLLKCLPWCSRRAKDLLTNEVQSILRGSTNGAEKIFFIESPHIVEKGIKECGGILDV